MKQQLNILFLILFLVFDVFSTVYAASDLFCNNYAKSSQRQYQEGRRLGCGFPVNKSGWYSGFDYPFYWCKNQSVKNANKQRNNRNSQLESCRTKVYCRNYAKSSQRQYQEGRRLGCGFPVNKSGWYSGFDYPFRWCLKNSKSSAIKERNRRNNALTTCKMRKSGSGYNW